MLSVLVSCKLEESYMAAKVSKGVVCLGVSETEFEAWDTWEAPGGPMFGRELGRDPELEDFRLALQLVIVFTAVGGCEARDVYLAAIVVLTDALGKKVTGLLDLENLVGRLGLLRVAQTTPLDESKNRACRSALRDTHCLSSMSIAMRMKPLGVISCGGF